MRLSAVLCDVGYDIQSLTSYSCSTMPKCSNDEKSINLHCNPSTLLVLARFRQTLYFDPEVWMNFAVVNVNKMYCSSR